MIPFDFDYYKQISDILSGVLLNDLSGSAKYRKFVLKNTVMNLLETMKDV